MTGNAPFFLASSEFSTGIYTVTPVVLGTDHCVINSVKSASRAVAVIADVCLGKGQFGIRVCLGAEARKFVCIVTITATQYRAGTDQFVVAFCVYGMGFEGASSTGNTSVSGVVTVTLITSGSDTTTMSETVLMAVAAYTIRTCRTTNIRMELVAAETVISEVSSLGMTDLANTVIDRIDVSKGIRSCRPDELYRPDAGLERSANTVQDFIKDDRAVDQLAVTDGKGISISYQAGINRYLYSKGIRGIADDFITGIDLGCIGDNNQTYEGTGDPDSI
jgi:hypothetical protein